MSDGLQNCPVPECDFQGSREACKGHWGGMQDGDHSGKWHEAREAYEEARGESTEGSSEDAQTRAGAPETGESDTESSSGGNDPARDTPDSETSDDGTEDPGPCPECDGELADFRDSETVQRDGVMYDTPDDYYCSNCGQGWNYE